MRRELNLDKAIAEIARRLKAHIGSNGDAHLPVTTDANGFMTSAMLDQFNMLYKNRIRQPDNTDILKLQPGFYEGSKWLNHPITPTTPTTWISSITVTQGTDGRKQIWLQDNITGYTWSRTIHTGGDPASGSGDWMRLYQYEVLWSGSSPLTEPVTLTNPVYDDAGSRYSSIRVTYQGTNSHQAFGTRYGVNAQALNPSGIQGTIKFEVQESKVRFPTPTTAQVTYSMGHVYNVKSTTDNTIVGSTSDSRITITEIAGLR